MSGYYDAMMYVLLASVAFVFLDNLCQDVSPVIALFVMSGVALLCFNLLSASSLKQTYQSLGQHRWLFFSMSFALSIDWLCMVYATYLSDPFITMTALFVASAFLGFLSLYKETGLKMHLLSMLLLLISLVVLYFNYKIQKAGHLGYGILLGSLAGIAFFIYMLTSEKLCRRSNMSVLQVLATRFWVLFLGSACFINLHELPEVLQHHGLALVVISIGSLVLPIYFNQQAIQKLGTAPASILISLVPSTTYLIYTLWSKNLVFINMFVCILITAALVMPKLIVVKWRQ